MKIAYFSPLNPVQSGISDFSEELIMELKQCADITVFVDHYRPTNVEALKNVNIREMDEYHQDSVRELFDITVFHIGNNLDYHKKIMDIFLLYGGVLELHDFSLHHMIAGNTIAKGESQAYLSLMKYCHGMRGKREAESFLAGESDPPWNQKSMFFTMNKHLLDRASAIIVHSDFAKQMVIGTTGFKPICSILLPAADIVEDANTYKSICRQKLNIDTDVMVFGSFGYATAEKRILQTLDAFSRFQKDSDRPFHYFIVGQVSEIDVDGAVRRLGLESHVTVTGFVELDQFKFYLGACDCCLNLRYPTQGESSASLHRMLGMGKPVIVSNVGAFEEYPDDIVLKVRYDEHEIDDIYDAIISLTKSSKELCERGANALAYAKNNCNLQKNAKRYAEFFEKVITGTWKEDEWIDTLVDKLWEMNFIDVPMINSLAEKIGT